MKAAIAQLGERQTEDLKVSGSIPDRGIFLPTLEFLYPYTTSYIVARTIGQLKLMLLNTSISTESHSPVDFMPHVGDCS